MIIDVEDYQDLDKTVQYFSNHPILSSNIQLSSISECKMEMINVIEIANNHLSRYEHIFEDEVLKATFFFYY